MKPAAPAEAALAAWVTHGRGARHRAMVHRLNTLASVLVGGPRPATARELVQSLLDELRSADPSRVWLLLAVLRAELPTTAEVRRVVREIVLDGPTDTVRELLTSRALLERGRELRQVEVVVGQVVVDLHHTSHTALATGIQRVARQTARRWHRDHEVVLAGWTRDDRALRRLSPEECRTALQGAEPGSAVPRGTDTTVLVPWQGTYVVPELATESERTSRMQALAEFAEGRTGAIGFDCVPLTSAETTAEGMGAGFSGSLAALRHMDRVAGISGAAAREYTGWRSMLAGVGVPGPEVTAVSLPVEAEQPSAEAVAEARTLMLSDVLPLVLCVGSHEPRKNHLAVLHAAELAWRDGVRFSLMFVGGNAWNSDAFRAQLERLQAAGRPVESVSALSDDLLWAGYTVARCVLFPSLNEGFGLPVAEALSAGTPVITSGFGSMREIGDAGGALFVDPTDDHDLQRALTSLLTDDDLHARLAAAARHASPRTWEQYASELWTYLVAEPLPAARAAQPVGLAAGRGDDA